MLHPEHNDERFGIPDAFGCHSKASGPLGRLWLLASGGIVTGMFSLVLGLLTSGLFAQPSENVLSLKSPSTPIHSLCFAPEGLRIASCDTTGRLSLWQLPEEKPRSEWGGPDRKIKCLAFSPDRELMAWGTWDGSIVLWNLRDGRRETTLHRRDVSIAALEFSPDGKTLASGDVSGSLVLWDVSSGQLLEVHETQSRIITDLDFSSDSRSLTTAVRDDLGGMLLVVEVPSGEVRQQLRLTPQSIVRRVEFLPSDNKVLWLDLGAQHLECWDLIRGESESLFDVHHRVTSFALSPDGTTLALGTSEGEVMLRAWENLQVLHRLQDQPNPIHSLDFSHDGRLVAVGGVVSGLVVWKP
ncbi:WD40 repeat domain-containing protein [Tautonia rosea]|uniref:WD40 repeat domain-containing protein n=1 Tax=Tautonia rosea TaxID=2728037 RepID=UPI0014756F10|nr:WD40 repeat domain-containing protein [Tautonia rosea]